MLMLSLVWLDLSGLHDTSEWSEMLSVSARVRVS